MHVQDVKLSSVIFFVAGVGLLASLPSLANDNVAPWLAFNVFFFVGLMLFFLKR